MGIAGSLWASTKQQIAGWSWLKQSLAVVCGVGFVTSSFLFLTPTGEKARVWMAQTVITTQHREWAWMLVGKEKRDRMVAQLHLDRELMGSERQDFGMVSTKKKRDVGELIKIEDISGTFWKGKKMYIYDPRSIRVVVPAKPGAGEQITSMVNRTGAVAGVNGGGFVDPDGLGNGFAPIGFIISGGEIIYTDQEGSIPQHVVGFTKDGVLVVGKYSIDDLLKLNISEAVMFYPRVIANGKGLITTGDGGWGRGPRTAIGQKADGTVIIMVIDGRQTHSVGATLKEIQELMLEEGVVNAGFLDGGASSEMVTLEDGLITKPSSRYGERRLPSALLVFDDPKSYVANNPWKGITEIDPGGAYDNPGFLQEQANNKAQGKSGTTSPAKTTKPSATSTPRASTKPESSAAVETSPTQGGASSTPGGATEAPPAGGDAASASPSSSVKSTPPASPAGTTNTGGASTAPKPSASAVPAANGAGAAGTDTGGTGSGGTGG